MPILESNSVSATIFQPISECIASTDEKGSRAKEYSYEEVREGI